jgi:hypothetical protein
LLQTDLGIAALDVDDRRLPELTLTSGIARSGLFRGTTTAQMQSEKRKGRGVTLTADDSGEAKQARHDKFSHMDLSCSIDSSRLRHNTGDFYNCSQKATEFGQSVVKKTKAATGAAFA